MAAKPFIPALHPVHRLPTAHEAAALGTSGYAEFVLKREQVIAREKADPLRNFWEPPIWHLCDCLLGLPWVNAAVAAQVRQRLGFTRPLRFLTILGGNRAGKTQYCVTRALRLMFSQPGMSAWFWHESVKMSVDLHQKEFYRYLPPELKQADVKSKEAYIAYKRKTGFSDMSFILPVNDEGGLSDMTFKTYGEPTIEGANLDLVVMDELTGREASHAEIAETMPLRVAERDGIIIKPFTPVDGYSETVRMDMDGGVAVLESKAFLCPKDGGEPDMARALGLTEAELAECLTADRTKRAATAMQCRPETFEALTGGERTEATAIRTVPAGREFERVPRVVKCLDPESKKAVVFFHSADNPYGNPKNVASTIRSRNSAVWFVKERFHGVAHKTIAARFLFDRQIHVVPENTIPPASSCTNYHLGDPHSKRNMAMAWFSVTPEHVYLRREWPGSYYIPGVGEPGPWALPGRKPDGQPGPAQKPFGFGLRDYKREIARLEGWKDYREDSKDADDVDLWTPDNGTREPIEERELDARFASTPRMEKDRPVTLITQFDEVGLFFNGMPGDDIDVGLTAIDDALAFDRQRPVDFWNKPKLLISAECENTIYALETWTGVTKDGKTDRDGATKEWVDLLKGFFLRDRPYLGGSSATAGEMETATNKNYY
jgi:hypothetical protein